MYTIILYLCSRLLNYLLFDSLFCHVNNLFFIELNAEPWIRLEKEEGDSDIALFVSSGTSRVTVKEGKYDHVIVTYYPVRSTD